MTLPRCAKQSLQRQSSKRNLINHLDQWLESKELERLNEMYLYKNTHNMWIMYTSKKIETHQKQREWNKIQPKARKALSDEIWSLRFTKIRWKASFWEKTHNMWFSYTPKGHETHQKQREWSRIQQWARKALSVRSDHWSLIKTNSRLLSTFYSVHLHFMWTVIFPDFLVVFWEFLDELLCRCADTVSEWVYGRERRVKGQTDRKGKHVAFTEQAKI